MPDAGAVWVDVLPDLKKFGPRLKADLKGHADKGLKVPVGLDAKAARTELAAFKKQLDTIGRRTPRVRVSADTKSALANLVGVSKAADRLDGRIINMRVSTTGGGPVAPTVRAPSGGSGGGSQRPLTNMSAGGVAAAATFIPPLIPAVGALAGGLGAVASGFTAAGVGAAAFSLAVVPAIKEATTATGDLTAQQETFRASLGGLGAAWDKFRAQTDGAVLDAAARGVNVANVGLSKLTPTVLRSSDALGILADEARSALDGPRWTSFFDFMSRQATPSTLIFGRTLGNLATGVAGFAVSMEPLWNVVGPGLENMSAQFAAWGHNSENFTGFIAWTIENGPTFLDFFGQLAETAVDVGVALGPLGTIYAEGLTLLAGAISAVAETAPWLIQLAVAAKTAQVAIGLFSRVNTGLIQPMRELPGRVREYSTSLGTVAPAADGAAGGTSRFKGALGGVSSALGGPWGIAIAAGVIALGSFAAAKANAEQKVRDYTEALRADAGAIGENTRASVINTLEKEGALKTAEDLGVNIGLVTDAALGEADAIDEVNAELNRQAAALDKRLEQGEISEALYLAEGVAIEELREAINGENEAINKSASSYQRKTEAMGPAQEAQEGVNAAMAEGAFQARDLKTALDALVGANITAAEAEIRFEAAVDSANESIATNGANLDVTTEAGRNNKNALIELAEATHNHSEAMNENDVSAEEVIEEQKRARKEFIKVAKEMGATANEAEALADEYLGIPEAVSTAISVTATGDWRATSVKPDPDAPGRSYQLYATGGPVAGPGTATSDSIPAMLSDGEFVEPTHVVDHYGGGFFEALRQKRIPKSSLPGFATGGRVSTGSGDTPWDILEDHQGDVREEYNTLAWNLISRLGDSMGEQWANSISGPMGVVQLAEASIGRFPESNGNNTNAITDWFGMDGAAWCAMFISWLFAQTGASAALGGASRTAWTGDYYTSGMAQTRNPQPGDVAVYGTDHVNLVTTAGGGRRIGGNQSNNVTSAPYSGGAIFRPNWGAVGFAEGGQVSITDILAQDRKEDQRAGLHPILRGVQDIAGLASGGLASGWTVVGEEGPELARFDDPARIYSTQESARMLATAGAATTQGAAGAGTGPLVGEYHQHLHDAQATVREAMSELTHTLRVVDTGGLYG